MFPLLSSNALKSDFSTKFTFTYDFINASHAATGWILLLYKQELFALFIPYGSFSLNLQTLLAFNCFFCKQYASYNFLSLRTAESECCVGMQAFEQELHQLYALCDIFVI